MNNPKRYTLKDRTDKRPFSFPVERLGHSKERVQLALAVVVAELVVRLAIDPCERDRNYLSAAISCSGEVAHFTVQPEIGFEHVPIAGEATFVYVARQRICEGCLAEIVSEPAALRNGPSGWSDALIRYWREIDRRIPELLNDPALKAVRAT
ncbi:MAG: hypothetical protein HY735_03290 [Verrucomicrobia bacterium]|nr:hypothetical protein [Verrucomicrobiota bacterium]